MTTPHPTPTRAGSHYRRSSFNQLNPMRRGRQRGAALAFERRPNRHPPFSREPPGGRVCLSWRVWGSLFPAAPRETLGRAGTRSGLDVRTRGRPPLGAWGGAVFGPRLELGAREPPPPAGPFLPSPPRGVALVASLPAVPGLWNQLCLQTSPGRAGVRPRPAGARPPLASGGVSRPERGGPLEAAAERASAWTPAPGAARGPGPGGPTLQRGPCNIPNWVEGR